MDSRPHALGPATSHWNDYVGTAAADDAAVTLNTPSLYELAGIDRDRWTILGVDLVAADHTVTAAVYAIDRDAHNVTDTIDIEEIGRDAGEIPVSRFEIADPHLEEFVERAFRRISIRLIAKPVRDYLLVATESD
jgi:hypothetical protein